MYIVFLVADGITTYMFLHNQMLYDFEKTKWPNIIILVRVTRAGPGGAPLRWTPEGRIHRDDKHK